MYVQYCYKTTTAITTTDKTVMGQNDYRTKRLQEKITTGQNDYRDIMTTGT